jgi:hypothetical protein
VFRNSLGSDLYPTNLHLEVPYKKFSSPGVILTEWYDQSRLKLKMELILIRSHVSAKCDSNSRLDSDQYRNHSQEAMS